MERIEQRSVTNAQPNFFEQYGVYAEVPVELLWPTHPVAHYRRPSIRRVRHALSEQGVNFMRTHPINVVLLPDQDSSVLAIDDGHHRARLAPAFGIRSIPAFVADFDTVIKILNRDKEEERKRLESRTYTALSAGWTESITQQRMIRVETIPTSFKKAQELVAWLNQQQESHQPAA